MTNWISQKVQGVVATAGEYAGGAVNAAGNAVSGVGQTAGNTYVPP